MLAIQVFCAFVGRRAQHCAGALLVGSGLLNGCAAPASNRPAKAPVEASQSSGSSQSESEPEGPPSEGVDLSVTKISWSPAQPKAGQPLTFSATVKNRGTVATEEGTIVGVAFQINGMTVSWSDTSKSSLGPGQSRTLTANFGPGETSTWTAVSGEHTLTAWVDDVNRFPDTNRNNNTNEATLVVR